MRSFLSHIRWNRFRSWAPILIPAIVGLSAGTWLGYQSQSDTIDAYEVTRSEDLQTQTQLLTESIWTSIQDIRTQALAIRKIRESSPQATPTSGGRILHWAELEIQGERLTRVKQSAANSQWMRSFTGAKTWESHYLQSTLQRITTRQLKDSGIAALRMKRDADGRQEWLSIAFPLYSDTTNKTLTGAIVTLVDPNDTFAVFSRFKNKTRAYLVGGDGNVLAHSTPTLVGSDFSHTGVFADGARSLFLSSTMIGTGNFSAFDQLPVTAAYSRIGDLPFAAVIESTRTPGLTAAGGSENWMRIFGQVLISLGSITLAIFFARRLQNSLVEEADLRPSATPLPSLWTQPTQTAAPQPSMAGAPSQTPTPAQPHHSASRPLLSRQQAFELALRFEEEIRTTSAKDIRTLGTRLSRIASDICDSPILFFGFHARSNQAILDADAGFDRGGAPASLAFPISKEITHRILRSTQEGKVVSLEKFEPLAKVILERTGVAHFEAWAVTSPQPALLGVLVILHAGVQSANHRDSLVRVMKATALAYEPTP